jgi:hypothetical protein
MVARINPSRSIRNVFHYNENKLDIVIDEEKGIRAATFIHASGFAKDTHDLTTADKIKTLEKLISLNTRAKIKAVHISLNFDPTEKDMPHEKMRNIADAYMQKIGFGSQPYLVYKHNDADHPHIHIVTTNIRKNKPSIELHNIGKNQSEQARKQIEIDFNLVRAEAAKQTQAYSLKPINAAKILAGKHPKTGIKRAITNVLDHVLPTYKYGSLTELNAILQQWNVVADRGGKDSRIYQNKGLVFRVLNADGKKEGVPIPASHIYSKPTLPVLEDKFIKNEPLKQRLKARIKNVIDMAFARQPTLSLEGLITALQKEKIQLVAYKNDSGLLYGLTYVDHEMKCAFKGSELGAKYGANEIRQRCADLRLAHPQKTQQQQETQLQKPGHSQSHQPGQRSHKRNSSTKQDTVKTRKKNSSIEPQPNLLTADKLPPASMISTTPAPTTNNSAIELLTETKKKRRKKQKR